MIAPRGERDEAVWTAVDLVRGVGNFWKPLGEMERVAVEPLPDVDDFLPRWRARIASRAVEERRSDWDREEDHWLREVVQRLDGAEGLAGIARSTRRANDLRAWCKSLVDAGDWKAALSAFEEAAGLVADKDHARGEFLDGAALAAQTLGRADLPARLERAWRGGPSMPRLCRWLGSSASKATLGQSVAEAFEACPEHAARQRALLHVLQRDFASAAQLLAAAAGLGWSTGEHPGHLLFPLFARLLGGERRPRHPSLESLSRHGLRFEELDSMIDDHDEPRLLTPDVDALLQLAGIEGIADAASRSTVVAAMRKAAENRIAGVTELKRRHHYRHAAELVATCVACDRTGETVHWAEALKVAYRRFPALRDALTRATASS